MWQLGPGSSQEGCGGSVRSRNHAFLATFFGSAFRPNAPRMRSIPQYLVTTTGRSRGNRQGGYSTWHLECCRLYDDTDATHHACMVLAWSMRRRLECERECQQHMQIYDRIVPVAHHCNMDPPMSPSASTSICHAPCDKAWVIQSMGESHVGMLDAVKLRTSGKPGRVGSR